MDRISREAAARLNAILDEAGEQLIMAVKKIAAEQTAAKDAGDGDTAWFLYRKGAALCRIEAQLEELKVTGPIY